MRYNNSTCVSLPSGCRAVIELAVDVIAEIGEACVSDNHLVLVQEYVLRVEVFVDNASGMEVAHCHGNLLSDVDTLLQVEVF